MSTERRQAPQAVSLRFAVTPGACPSQTDAPRGRDEARGVYVISIAARMLEMHPQTLRKYERAGLVTPSRTTGMLRMYSEEDIAKLRLIQYLSEDLGMNIAGVQLVLDLLQRMLRLRRATWATDNVDLMRAGVERELRAMLARLDLPANLSANQGGG